jgi:methionine-rich copper-binding protein CopC
MYLVSVKMTAGDIITILRFKVKVTDMDGGAARTAGRNVNEPEKQQAIVVQKETKPGRGIKVYPNPVTRAQFTLRMDSVTAGRYLLELYTAGGQLVYKQPLNHTGKSAIYPIQLPATLARGIYMLKLAGAHAKHTEKLIVE